MIKKVVFIFIVLLLTSCSTTEFRKEKSICRAIWMKKIPPVYEQEMYNKVMSRQVPTGRTNCYTTGSGNYAYTNCNQIMKTEYYSVPTMRTVDRNAPSRDKKITACTRQKCTEKYRNNECKS